MKSMVDHQTHAQKMAALSATPEKQWLLIQHMMEELHAFRKECRVLKSQNDHLLQRMDQMQGSMERQGQVHGHQCNTIMAQNQHIYHGLSNVQNSLETLQADVEKTNLYVRMLDGVPKGPLAHGDKSTMASPVEKGNHNRLPQQQKHEGPTRGKRKRTSSGDGQAKYANQFMPQPQQKDGAIELSSSNASSPTRPMPLVAPKSTVMPHPQQQGQMPVLPSMPIDLTTKPFPTNASTAHEAIKPTIPDMAATSTPDKVDKPIHSSIAPAKTDEANKLSLAVPSKVGQTREDSFDAPKGTMFDQGRDKQEEASLHQSSESMASDKKYKFRDMTPSCMIPTSHSPSLFAPVTEASATPTPAVQPPAAQLLGPSTSQHLKPAPAPSAPDPRGSVGGAISPKPQGNGAMYAPTDPVVLKRFVAFIFREDVSPHLPALAASQPPDRDQRQAYLTSLLRAVLRHYAGRILHHAGGDVAGSEAMMKTISRRVMKKSLQALAALDASRG